MTKRDRDLLQKIHNAGIILIIEGQSLKYKAPAGILTQELRAALAEIKPDLVYEYNERAGILEYDARMDRDKAEAQASAILKGKA
jgi:hypothetical protein